MNGQQEKSRGPQAHAQPQNLAFRRVDPVANWFEKLEIMRKEAAGFGSASPDLKTFSNQTIDFCLPLATNKTEFTHACVNLHGFSFSVQDLNAAAGANFREFLDDAEGNPIAEMLLQACLNAARLSDPNIPASGFSDKTLAQAFPGGTAALDAALSHSIPPAFYAGNAMLSPTSQKVSALISSILS